VPIFVPDLNQILSFENQQMEKADPEIPKAIKNCQLIFGLILLSIVIILYGLLENFSF
jgi:hypothetical protein